MILVSFLLVAVALVVLAVGAIAGWLLDVLAFEVALLLIYVSIGIVIVAAILLAVGTFRARDEIFGTQRTTASGKGGRPTSGAAKATAAKTKGDASRKATTAGPTRSAAGARSTKTADARSEPSRKRPAASASASAAPEIPSDQLVVVVPGRRRYHLSNCRQLANRPREEITYAAAREDGFTSCTACMPDAVLAARASRPDSDASAPERGSASADASADAGDSPTAADDADTRDSESRQEAADDAADDDNGETVTPTEEFAAVTGRAEAGERGDDEQR